MYIFKTLLTSINIKELQIRLNFKTVITVLLNFKLFTNNFQQFKNKFTF